VLLLSKSDTNRTDLTAAEYRAVMDELGVEQHPRAASTCTSRHRPTTAFRSSRSGMSRRVEIWDEQENFESFLVDVAGCRSGALPLTVGGHGMPTLLHSVALLCEVVPMPPARRKRSLE
jgi:hypothetical protein